MSIFHDLVRFMLSFNMKLQYNDTIMSISKLICAIPVILLLLISQTAYSSSDINIVTTIKPLHGLVSAVVAGTNAKATLLIPANKSPHNYNLKPTDMRQLSRANVIFWTGTDIEAFMYNALGNPRIADKAINFSGLSGLTLLPRKALEGVCPNCKDKNDKHAENMQDIDPHYWLDPHNAIVMIDAISKTLCKLDPENIKIYTKNSLTAKTRLINLNKELSARLATVKNVPFLVIHNAYQYLQNRYSLNYLGAIVVNPGIGLSAKRLQKITAVVKARRPVCIFQEPQINSKVIANIQKQAGYDLYTATLDPLGVDLANDQESYFMMMHNLAKNIQSCLIKDPDHSN
ncbi:MAG: hypothetical protein COC15_04285 [Legionellales bacterium]|nr:MAG: hypothetical protein COC15_04285 [Legionellales bacterium]